MSTLAQPEGPRGAGRVPPESPLVLWNRVLAARRAVDARRNSTRDRWLLAAARGELLCALDAYVASLTRRGLPVPYALRDELRLQRLTCPNEASSYQPQTGPRDS